MKSNALGMYFRLAATGKPCPFAFKRNYIASRLNVGAAFRTAGSFLRLFEWFGHEGSRARRTQNMPTGAKHIRLGYICVFFFATGTERLVLAVPLAFAKADVDKMLGEKFVGLCSRAQCG